MGLRYVCRHKFTRYWKMSRSVTSRQLGERGAQRQPCAMQKHPHVPVADPEDLTDLGWIEPLLHPEHDHGSLRGWKGVDGRTHVLGKPASSHDPLRRDLFPKLGHLLPPAMPVEGSGQVVVLAAFVERHRSPVAPCPGPRLVDQDRED